MGCAFQHYVIVQARHEKGTLLGFDYTITAVLAILLSAMLGLLVSLSTFLVIASTSSLTYNVVGHLKTVIILTGAGLTPTWLFHLHVVCDVSEYALMKCTRHNQRLL